MEMPSNEEVIEYLNDLRDKGHLPKHWGATPLLMSRYKLPYRQAKDLDVAWRNYNYNLRKKMLELDKILLGDSDAPSKRAPRFAKRK